MAVSPGTREAIARYDAKTYTKINIALRNDEDAEIIESWKAAQEKGIKNREWLRGLYEKAGE